jgi:hypothetical protein
MMLTPTPPRIITRHKNHWSVFVPFTSDKLPQYLQDVLEWVYRRLGPCYLAGLNQMEGEMCNYLNWELTVDNPISGNFNAMAQGFPSRFRGAVSDTLVEYGVEALDTPTHSSSNITPPIPSIPKTIWFKVSLGSILPK